jgi:hypothetical protein
MKDYMKGKSRESGFIPVANVEYFNDSSVWAPVTADSLLMNALLDTAPEVNSIVFFALYSDSFILLVQAV